MKRLELWGGHECTLNRVGDHYRDQTQLSGHHERASDLDSFAKLGVSALRYPVLWERVAPQALDRPNWSWTDQRLHRLRELNIRPIAGLVHHGAGPVYATLLSSEFAPSLAAFARAAAERYPWVEEWTPVNEPLTTARFSALYGHWHPHLRDEQAFWRALLNQIDGVRMAMREIRKVIPAAKLIQTEDLGRTFSTAEVTHQAGFDNARRWMTWDLLFGRVTEGHPLWLRLTAMGLGDRLAAIADDPCPPDIVGVNHYLTSDRFLDHRTRAYPRGVRGGNRFMKYADVEAVRVSRFAPSGLQGALEETWSRYGAPIAITEVHNGCTREEQMRWLAEAWDTSQALKARGVDVRAVTAWSLLGAYDWNSLLTKQANHYEPGVFDLRGPTQATSPASVPRPTGLAHLMKALATGEARPPGANGPGWWRRDARLLYSPVTPHQEIVRLESIDRPREERPVLIVGATGTLGRMLARSCEARAIPFVLSSRADFSLEDASAVERTLDRISPWAVINAAGWVRVDDAERERDACMKANAEGAIALAQAATSRGARFVTFSSDLVFDGEKGAAYVESDAANALNVYGHSKAVAEARIQELCEQALIVRTAAFFSPHDPYNFAEAVVRELGAGRPFIAADCVVSPTYVPDLCDAVLDLLIDGERGIWHLANDGALSWAEFARSIARVMQLDPSLVQERRARDMGWTAARPAFAALGSERASLLPSLERAIERYAQHSVHRQGGAWPKGGRGEIDNDAAALAAH